MAEHGDQASCPYPAQALALAQAGQEREFAIPLYLIHLPRGVFRGIETYSLSIF